MAKPGDWMTHTMHTARDAHLARQAAAVARAAAQARERVVLETAWPAWWAGVGESLATVADAAAGALGRAVFRVSGGGDQPWVLALLTDPGAASIRFVSDLDAPAAVMVAVAAPLRSRVVEPRGIVIDGDRVQVGGSQDAPAFVRAVVEPWLAQVVPLALGRDGLGW
jgi:hypothetical protein